VISVTVVACRPQIRVMEPSDPLAKMRVKSKVGLTMPLKWKWARPSLSSPTHPTPRSCPMPDVYRVERAEIGLPGEFDALQDDELERLLVQHLGELGFSLSIAEERDAALKTL
jgi:hypothetical protein